MTESREWDHALMDEKGVVCKDDNWRQGATEIIVNRNPIKKNLSYDAILHCIPPPPSSIPTPTPNTEKVDQLYLLKRDTGVIDSGATHLYIYPTAQHGPPDTSTHNFV